MNTVTAQTNDGVTTWTDNSAVLTKREMIISAALSLKRHNGGLVKFNDTIFVVEFDATNWYAVQDNEAEWK